MLRIFSFLVTILLSSPSHPAGSREGCEAPLLDARLEKILRKSGFDDALLRQSAIFHGEFHRFAGTEESKRPVVVVHAPGREALVYEIMADVFYEVVEPSRQTLGAKITVDGRYVLGPGMDGRWSWSAGLARLRKIGPGQRDPALAEFAAREAQALRHLFRIGHLDAERAFESEILSIDSPDDPRAILRLPLADGETDERFRAMWVFRPGSVKPAAMEVELAHHSFYGQIFWIDARRYVFLDRSQEDGRGRAGLLHTDDGVERVAAARNVSTHSIEALRMQPTPVDMSRVEEGFAVTAAPLEPSEPEIVIHFDREGQVITIGSNEPELWPWPSLRAHLLRHRVFESASGTTIEVQGSGDPHFTYRIFDGLGAYHDFLHALARPLGAEWFERRRIPLVDARGQKRRASEPASSSR